MDTMAQESSKQQQFTIFLQQTIYNLSTTIYNLPNTLQQY